MKKNTSVKTLVLASLFAALTCVATFIHIHLPGMPIGYVNLGDTMVIISAILLGPIYGALAAAIGPALTDLFLGYGSYVPGTFVIKFAMAVAAYYIFKLLSGKTKEIKVIPLLVAGLVAEAIMVSGYFVYETIFFGGFSAAIPSILGNCLQGGFSLILATILLKVLGVTKVTKMI